MGLLFDSKSGQVPDYYYQKNRAEKEAGRKLSNEEFERDYLNIGGGSSLSDTGTSIFDPCLCEMDYSWFTREGDAILDPFAGGSVRGIVASVMGREYTGIELRPEQVQANTQQGIDLCEEPPRWICGDSLNVDELVGEAMFDHIFTCPPYGDLETYSDDPSDLSNMGYEDFDATYTEIIARAAKHLRDDRFATIVVGNYRDRKGYLRDLSGLTVRAFEAAGLRYYNDMVLVTPCGSLPVRVGKQFSSTRKVGRTHQHILSFVKGDRDAAAERLGEITVASLETIINEFASSRTVGNTHQYVLNFVKGDPKEAAQRLGDVVIPDLDADVLEGEP